MKMTLSPSTLKSIIITTTVFAVIAMAFVAPIPQDPAFHQFADQRTWLSIANYWNVLTNFGFLWVGLFGLYKLLLTKQLNVIPKIKINYAVFLLA